MYIGKVILKLCRDGYFVDLKIVLQQSQHYPSNILDARPRASIGCVFRQFADARNDCTCAKAFGLYVSKNLVHFLQVARVRAPLAEGCAGIKRDSAQGRPQLMGDSGRDSLHAQSPVGAFASLQDDRAGKP
jgi:hypothetical protein